MYGYEEIHKTLHKLQFFNFRYAKTDRPYRLQKCILERNMIKRSRHQKFKSQHVL